MKTTLLNTIRKMTFIVIAIFLLSNQILAQDSSMPEDLYFEIACFKAKKPGAINYFKTTGNAINQEMIRTGVIENWSFFKVDFPNGSACECDFRAIRTFRGIEALEKLKDNSIREQIIKTIWPHKSRADISREFNELIDFRYSHVYNMVDALVPKATTSKMMVVNFMDVEPKNRSSYLEMENEIFKPLHAANHKNGGLVDWVVARRSIPYGAEIKTDFITIDKYDSYSKMQNSNFMETFKKVHPDIDGPSTMAKMSTLRSLIKAEVWQHVPTE